jgi:hypothetical protein
MKCGRLGWRFVVESGGWRDAISETRKLVAILVADIVGYSRLAGVIRRHGELQAMAAERIHPILALSTPVTAPFR